MSASGVIVSEETGRWAAALRRENVRVARETRGLDACWRELAERPAAFVFIELRPDNAEQVLVRTIEIEREFPQAALAVVLPHAYSSFEPGLRELGAVAVVSSLLQISMLTPAIQTHLARFEPTAGELFDQIMAASPWAE